MNNLQDLFNETLRDTYNAEKQLVKALPKMIKTAQNESLKDALTVHLDETKEHVARIEQVAETLGIKPSGVHCKGMEGLIAEADEHLGKEEPGPVTDALIIALAQKCEHYEIAAYGTLLTFAKTLGITDKVDPLRANMDDEENADELLSTIAEKEVNVAALGDLEVAPKSTKSTTKKASIKDSVSVK
jgi:ferritin-like metal-binding protein YciE